MNILARFKNVSLQSKSYFQIKDTYLLSSSMEAIVYCWMTAASTPIQGRSGVCCSGWAAKHTNDRMKTANMGGGAVCGGCDEK